ALADALARGVAPGSEEAGRLAERHRATISRHYECTRSMQVVLARMYTEDPRFAAHYDQRAEGLAAWLRAVIEEDARAHGIDPETAGWQGAAPAARRGARWAARCRPGPAAGGAGRACRGGGAAGGP